MTDPQAPTTEAVTTRKARPYRQTNATRSAWLTGYTAGRAAALAEAAERVRALPVHVRRNGWATPVRWVTRRAVLDILVERP